MSYNVNKIFEDVAYLSKVHTKKEYEAHTINFKEDRYGEFEALVKASDVTAECKQFCEDVFAGFKKFGKVRGTDQMNLNYFMIYYVFPTILSEEEKGQEICDNLKDVWNERFKCNINYTDYNSLYDGFQTKIFGIPIRRN
ncbi:hypothetical protein SAMN02910298_01558 [Pseudobutyrivibrio sp. YE44]|uniref:hypothetical protein n=1 Tax=Pseudobutyrivibrio sp. YE44 TaxID=1520802 RepID=UPI000883492B|nr:hypothetical protein [Pseudobutyrivibrio sp. YE44]SDB31381.1 hypothetical protein SAMN02910298_01558 [Pseudobutyrivibrio sp. YE44]